MDGASGYGDAGLEEIPGDQSSVELEGSLHQVLWGDDSFQVVALSESGDEIARSVGIELDQVDINQMIGYFKSDTPAGNGAFGYHLALSDNGEVMAVSEPWHSNEGQPVGAVYIFRKGAEGWVPEQLLENPYPENWKLFGFNLALDGEGNTLSVISVKNDESNSALHIFTRGETEWAATVADTLGAIVSYEWGFPMDFSGDDARLAISAPTEDAAAVCNIFDGIFDFGQNCSFMPIGDQESGDAFGSSSPFPATVLSSP